jgi:hypothetical protein
MALVGAGDRWDDAPKRPEALVPAHGSGAGLHASVVDLIAEWAREESGGDGNADVTIKYTLLLDLLDGYRVSGLMRQNEKLTA